MSRTQSGCCLRTQLPVTAMQGSALDFEDSVAGPLLGELPQAVAANSMSPPPHAMPPQVAPQAFTAPAPAHAAEPVDVQLPGIIADGLHQLQQASQQPNHMQTSMPRRAPPMLGSAMDFEDSVAGSFACGTPRATPQGGGEEMGTGELARAPSSKGRAGTGKHNGSKSLFARALEEHGRLAMLGPPQTAADFEDSIAGALLCGTPAHVEETSIGSLAVTTPKSRRRNGEGTPAATCHGQLLQDTSPYQASTMQAAAVEGATEDCATQDEEALHAAPSMPSTNTAEGRWKPSLRPAS